VIGSGLSLRYDDEKKFNRAVRTLFKTQDMTRLTDDAMQACSHLDVKPDDLH
jgi:hypothetical protein